MTISVPHLWNWSQRSFCSRVTLGSSWTLSSSGRGILGGIPPKGKPGNLGNIPMPFGSPAGVLKLFVGPKGEKPGCCGGWAAPGCPWIMPGGNPKSGRGAKFGMNGVEKAMFALHGDILLRTYTSKFTFLVVQVHCVCAVNVHKSYVLLVVFLVAHCYNSWHLCLLALHWARECAQVRCEDSQLLPVANLMFNCFIKTQ